MQDGIRGEELITELFECYERNRTVGVNRKITHAGYTV